MFYLGEFIEQVVYYLHFNTYFQQVCNYKHQWRWHNDTIMCRKHVGHQYLEYYINNTISDVSKKIRFKNYNFYNYKVYMPCCKRIEFETFNKTEQSTRINVVMRLKNGIYEVVSITNNGLYFIDINSNYPVSYIYYNHRNRQYDTLNYTLQLLSDMVIKRKKHTEHKIVFVKDRTDNYEIMYSSDRCDVLLYKHFASC
jgi:hypothetical protein